MPFDIQGAKREGYTDAEIVEYLASKQKYDVAGARKEGYKDADIIGHLQSDKSSDEIDGVPKWGRENPNLYGVYGAGKELAKSMPYVKYADPEERKTFMKKDTQGQTRDLLMENLNLEAMLGAGPILKGVGAIAGPVVERLAPSLYKTMTKTRSVSPKKTSLPEPVVTEPVTTVAQEGITEPVPEIISTKKIDIPIATDTIIQEVKSGVVGELPKYAEKSAINLERLNTTDDVKQFINQQTIAAEDIIGKRKVSWEETRAQAELLGWDVKAIKKAWESKGSFSAAEIDATRQTNINTITDLHELIKGIPAGKAVLTPEIRAKFLDSMELIKVTSQAASEAGRALNIHKRVLANDPAFKATSEFNRALKAISGKGVKRTDELIGKMRDIDFGDTAAVNRLIYDTTKTKWEKLSDGAFELWINGLLSNPLTHVVNTTSNALTIAYSVPERIVGAGIEVARSKLTGTPRQMFFGESAQEVFSISKGLRDGVNRFVQVMKKGDSANKLDYRPSAFPEKVNQFTPTRALMAEDSFFKGFIENAELNRLAFRQAKKAGLRGEEFKSKVTELLTSPTEGMLEVAAHRGKYLTYQEELGTIGNLIYKSRELVPGLKYFVPFVKTPTNIAKFALSRTPLGFANVVSKAMSGELKGAALSEELAKPLMGTMLATTVYQLAQQGYITGGQSKKTGEQNEKLATGWQPYSFKIGDKYYGYGRLEPLGSIVGMVADMSQIKKEMDESANFNLGAAVMGSITNNISNKTFMQGLTNIIQLVSDPGRYGPGITRNLASSVIPAVAGGVTRAIDPVVRDVRSIPDALQSKIPIVAESLPSKLTVWGDPIQRPGTKVSRLLSPMQISQEKGSPLEKELTKLDLDVGYPSRKIGDVELKPDEYWQMVSQGGSKAKSLLDKLVTTNAWKSTSPYKQEKIINKYVDLFRKEAKKDMIIKLKKEGRLSFGTEKELMAIVNQLM